MSEEKKESPVFAVKKKVDESWKQSVSASPQEEPKVETASQAEVNFESFISGIALQAVNATNEGKWDQARYLIDTLQMLAEKTKGNLTLEQSRGLQDLLYRLQLQFVEKSKQEGS